MLASVRMIRTVKCIDAHVGGAPVRLLVDGVPRPLGQTMAQKRGWMQRHADALRRQAMHEPRGHADMTGVILTEPVSPGAHAGLLFMDAWGFPRLCGHAVIAAATIAVERDLVLVQGDTPALVFDTPAGAVHVRMRLLPRGVRRRVDSVVLTNVPSFVAVGGHPVRLGLRELRVDVAFGGLFYAIVDTEAIGVPLDGSRLPELRRLTAQIREAVDTDGAAVHPQDRSAAGLDGVIFTGPPRDPEAHLRNVTVSGSGAVDRSPSATGTSAVMAVLDAMGLLQEEGVFVHESLIGSLHRGRVAQRTQVGELPAIVPEIEGSAWITSEHSLLVDEEDPLKDGFQI